jgi:predicted dehydrogenase
MSSLSNRLKYALVGTGHRGTSMWGRDLHADWSDQINLVGLCDSNQTRLSIAKTEIASDANMYDDFDEMLQKARPELVAICTPDHNHDTFIIKALSAGIDVITEKPMTTTLEKAKTILLAEKHSGKTINVAFNYRFIPVFAKIKELLLAQTIGTLTSIDFHWYLDTKHGADYFRRWHAFIENSGSLFIHKATHHFDIINWLTNSEPSDIFARGALNIYGKSGHAHAQRCSDCVARDTCDYALLIDQDEWLNKLYAKTWVHDDYYRDACVFRNNINIYDTMSALLTYKNGVQLSYSLNAAMPLEGYHLAINGTKGRIELRQYDRQPWSEEKTDTIHIMRNFGAYEKCIIPHLVGGHFGGDKLLKQALFNPDFEDRLSQKAGSWSGLLAMICGYSACESIEKNCLISISEKLQSLQQDLS